ncbi:hypothetical protein [Telluribacter sp. SYSU D00476]|uniref:hypothetical protein n=1 Tax=Telluribacter sp. SYSU D00476 TaxID=2811430 RepID=UPI001FF2F09D|nr:hypothetical protein [Telluribacter sp. SYSU D00476]
MRSRISTWIVAGIIGILTSYTGYSQSRPQTIVEIRGEQFYINGKPTYAGRYWNGHKIEGLLMNSRMVQGIFDDLNPETRKLFGYPDTRTWDPDRNTNEFVKAMDEWYRHGLLGFTLNLQGGSPTGYGNKGWLNSAFDAKGNLRPDYMTRLDRILKRADELGMVVMLGLFYFGQDEYLEDERAVINAVDNATGWLFRKGYRNVLIEINNECNIRYDHAILQPERVHELIEWVKQKEENGYRLLVSTSYGGGAIPKPNVVGTSDYILLHGNGVEDPARITKMVEQTRQVESYRNQPIVFNEDDHFAFDQPDNNFINATRAYASWGYFDYRKEGEGFHEGYQSMPADWGINSDRKRGFFNKVKEITGGFERE